ncbi:MAG TPA: hypothetical protein VN914_14340, partial [Polyangia bacterium]|nr:hypothetical protein [Polyangia bacterium]
MKHTQFWPILVALLLGCTGAEHDHPAGTGGVSGDAGSGGATGGSGGATGGSGDDEKRDAGSPAGTGGALEPDAGARLDASPRDASP